MDWMQKLGLVVNSFCCRCCCFYGFIVQRSDEVLVGHCQKGGSQRNHQYSIFYFYFFGRNGFIFFQNRPVDGVVDGISAQKSLIASLFIAVTVFRCCLY